jgi:hypothetical protein
MQKSIYFSGVFKDYYPNMLNYILVFEMPWVLNGKLQPFAKLFSNLPLFVSLADLPILYCFIFYFTVHILFYKITFNVYDDGIFNATAGYFFFFFFLVRYPTCPQCSRSALFSVAPNSRLSITLKVEVLLFFFTFYSFFLSFLKKVPSKI